MPTKTAKKSTPKKTIKQGGRTYRQDSCHTSEAAAKRAAEKLRNQGFIATTNGNCSYKGRKRRTKKQKSKK